MDNYKIPENGGYACPASRTLSKLVRGKLGTNSDRIGAESTGPFGAIIQALNGDINLGALKQVIETSVGKLDTRTGREKEVRAMIKKVLGKEAEPNTLNYEVRLVAEKFYVSGSTVDKNDLLATLEKEKTTKKNAAIEDERRTQLEEQLTHCPVWSKLQDRVQRHVRKSCPEYTAYRYADASAKVEDASFVAKKMEEVSMTNQTATDATMTTVVNSREETTTTRRGKTVITKVANSDDREVYDAWQSSSRGRGYGRRYY